jgi:hypothetical protein
MADEKKWNELSADEKIESLKRQLETALNRIQTCENDIEQTRAAMGAWNTINMNRNRRR